MARLPWRRKAKAAPTDAPVSPKKSQTAKAKAAPAPAKAAPTTRTRAPASKGTMTKTTTKTRATATPKAATKSAGTAKATTKAAVTKAAAGKAEATAAKTPPAKAPAKAVAAKAPSAKAPTAKTATPKTPPSRQAPAIAAKTLEKLKVRLEEERETYVRQADELLAEAEALMADREPGDTQFDEESGEGDTINVERERDLALSASARQSVEEIDAALARMASGTYGICERCGNRIPVARLEAVPQASLCIECKSRQERRR